MQALKQIEIVGGGLSGLSLAIALRNRNVPVIVHEALSYPRHRVCGEFISGVSQQTLDALGIADIMEQCERHDLVSWWNGATMMGQYRLPSAAYAISRYRLDALLCDRLRAVGGVVQETNRQQFTDKEGLVWAAGRRPAKGQWLGLKMHVRGLTMSSGLEMHLGQHGYAGLARVEDGWVNLCGLFRIQSDIQGKQEELLLGYLHQCGLHVLADKIEHCEWRVGSFHATAGFHLGRQQMPTSMLGIGDSESIIPPFTGNGMSMALQAAEMGISPLEQYANHQQSWQQTLQSVHELQHRRFLRRLTFSQWMHRLILAPSLRRPLEILSTNQLLPFRFLYSVTR